MVVRVLRLSALWTFPHLFIKENCPWSWCTWIITVENKLVSHTLLIIAVLNCIVETNWRGSGAKGVPIKPQPPKIQSQQYLTLCPLSYMTWFSAGRLQPLQVAPKSASKVCREQLSLPSRRWGTTFPLCCREASLSLLLRDTDLRSLPVPWPLLFSLARRHSSLVSACKN